MLGPLCQLLSILSPVDKVARAEELLAVTGQENVSAVWKSQSR